MWLWPLALAGVVGAFTLDGGFVFDDQAAILTSPVVQADVPWTEAFSRDFWGQPLDAARASWRPALPLVWRGLWALGDGAALPFRLLSLLLHMLATGAVYQLGRRLGLSAGALIGASLFAVHPLRSEAVGAIVAQADVASTFFGLAAVLAIAGERPRAVLAAVALAVGILFKESAVLFVAPVAAAAWLNGPGAPERRPALGRAAAVLAPTLLVALLGTWMQFSFPRPAAGPADNLAFATEGMTRLLHGLAMAGKLTRFTLLPIGLSPHHGYAEVDDGLATLLPDAAIGLVTLAMLMLVMARAVRRHDRLVLVLTTIALPVLALQSQLAVTLPTDLGERIGYGLLVSMGLGLGAAFERGLDAHARRVATAALVALSLAGSWVAQRPWASEPALWEHALTVTPKALRVQRNISAMRFRDGRYEDGLWHLMVVVHLEARLPAPVDWEPITALEAQPVGRRLGLGPGILAADAPCPFALRWLNRAFRDPVEALERWEEMRALYGCPSLGGPAGAASR